MTIALRPVVPTVALLCLIPLVAAGCRGGDDSAAPGVTDEPCPDAVNEDNGCIYLGSLTDFTGPFAAYGTSFYDSAKAFWRRVNEEGGIGGYDVDLTEYVRDTEYNPAVHVRGYQDIRDDVLGLAFTVGSPGTAAIREDMAADDMVGIPGSFTSALAFDELIIESGANYCVESMDAIDWYVENQGQPEQIMAVHYAGEFGGDAAQGARIAADEYGVDFESVETVTGAANQAGAIQAIVRDDPDVVVITTSPVDMAEIVGETIARGFDGQFLGTAPTWDPALLDHPAIEEISRRYHVTMPFRSWETDSPGINAMKDEVGDVEPHPAFMWGWAWQYPLLEGLERAVEEDSLTREGLRDAMAEITGEVDYEGFLPEGTPAGVYDDPNEGVVRDVVVAKVDPNAPTGVTVVQDFFTGPTAEAYDFEEPCYELAE